jgi:L-iditol 2-dehydrogenase
LSDFPRAVELLETGMVKVDPLVTHRFPLSQALDAFAVACSKDQNGAIKIVIDCQS